MPSEESANKISGGGDDGSPINEPSSSGNNSDSPSDW